MYTQTKVDLLLYSRASGAKKVRQRRTRPLAPGASGPVRGGLTQNFGDF